MLKKKHSEAIFMQLADGERSFNELAAITTPTAVHEIMKMAEGAPLNLVKSYYDSKTGHKMFKLLVDGFKVDFTPREIKIDKFSKGRKR